LTKQQQKLAEYHDINEDESEEDVESQDEGDMGFGTYPGGGFTSMVSIHPYTDIELKYVVDNLKGYCTAQPVSSPEAVS